MVQQKIHLPTSRRSYVLINYTANLYSALILLMSKVTWVRVSLILSSNIPFHYKDKVVLLLVIISYYLYVNLADDASQHVVMLIIDGVCYGVLVGVTSTLLPHKAKNWKPLRKLFNKGFSYLFLIIKCTGWARASP